jgi:hypothetical protein
MLIATFLNINIKVHVEFVLYLFLRHYCNIFTLEKINLTKHNEEKKHK